MPVVPCWAIHELTLRAAADAENPFLEAALEGEFVAPSGRTMVVSGFYDGEDTWRLRFAPDEEGDWTYLLRGHGVDVTARGRLQCVAPEGPGRHGFIRMHPENPYAFAYADGAPFFPMGDTCYGLYTDSHLTAGLRRQYLDTRQRQRFNFIRFHIINSLTRAAAEPAWWPWTGTPDAPDLDRLNPAFFRGLDGVLRELAARRMHAELILLNFYQSPAPLPFSDTGRWTPARERLWLRYLVARYAAFSTIFLWTLANEYETHPDGQYRLDVPDDPNWAKATARLIKQYDPYGHPATVHPVVSSSTTGTRNRDPFEPPWRIGGFFGEDDAVDVLSQQTSMAAGIETANWDETLQCWRGDAAGVEASIAADRVYGKPVLNTENGYEYLRGYGTFRRQVHHTDKVRRASWRIVCAGGYFAAGFMGTQGFGDAYERQEPDERYPFVVSDMGAAPQLSALYDFFSGLPFWRTHPFAGVEGDVVALASPGEVYVAYLPHGGRLTLDLSALHGRATGQWFNPRTGDWEPTMEVAAGVPCEFTAPDGEDWVLLVAAAPTAPVEILIPDDGGTPRDPARIRQTGEHAWHVSARREEGPNPLAHAISRVELCLRNRSTAPQDVALAIDLDGDGTATRREGRWPALGSAGGVEERDYVYVRPPGGAWQRLDGELDGWTLRVGLRLPPGETLLGLSPCYGYEDYLRFVRSLPEGPLLRKELMGRSDGGREHWALRITDPSAPAEPKWRVLLVARRHAFETFGSFAVEGMVRYLLNEPRGANLHLFEFEIHPMLNVDGVALGYEYGAGVEHGLERDSTVCASGRLYFARIDDWRPHVLVSLHNWITPRAWDVISYTDVDAAGRRIDRAQEFFRWFFPLQTEFGKGWLNDVDAPLAHNWAREDEKVETKMTEPLMYARRRYRTEVWVPELPWFGRDDRNPAEVAREAGRRYLRALFQTLVRLYQLPGVVLEPPQEEAWLSAWEAARVDPAGTRLGRDTLPRGGPLMLDRVVFARGLALPAGTTASFALEGRWETFAAVVGVAEGGDRDAALELRVEGDGCPLWVAGLCRPGERRRRIELDVRGVRELTLATVDPAAAARAERGLIALWADAKVCRVAA
ncbi:MAG: DUF4038 domain-containing protein [Chloroflexi bacterium]|nr:DUF4038 domain-containing protein [Chloroflexota bacterium]